MKSIKAMQKILTPQDIQRGNFGLEKEGVRINDDATLTQTPHPKQYGDKLENPYITTDFSESQIEIVTPTFETINKTYNFLSLIIDIVNENLMPNEYIWTQSIPPILPEDDSDIPIAKYNNQKDGQHAEKYRMNLANKYGTKKQLISGIHYNFSLKDETIQKLYDNYDSNYTYREFKDQIYLKIVRNYLRYRWLIIYLMGASIAADETFIDECLKLTNHNDNKNAYYSTNATSFRNASCGYKNIKELFPRFDSVDHFIDDVNQFIKDGELSEAKELYTQIRLKAKDPTDMMKSLKKDGIQYIELRTVDINPFDKNGISINEMKFLHIFIIYLLMKEETDYVKWQEEGFINEEKVAEEAFNPEMRLTRDNKEIKLTTWANEIIYEITKINDAFNLDYDDIIANMHAKIENPENTYAKKLMHLVEDEGFIESQLKLAQKYKKQSQKSLKTKLKNSPDARKYYNMAIVDDNIL